ncbi:methyltransferase domain-containing protein [Amycolatopsis jejuensis]|uniref:methyltransferase domain-containing protein n=1 Tax=Amycolatopsis jejuensis TaxID=330084 RepID=UPI001B8000FD|nr:methyltransferase domain-containing protein [Amycolatopsis jejuensis]
MSTLLDRLDLADAQPGAAEFRAATYDLLRLRAGATVVDVGCGAGRAAGELTDRGARVLAVDPDPAMLSAARLRRPDVDFRPGTAESLPLADGAVAGYRADKVFHEVADLPGAVAEAFRVLMPSGRIVLSGQDWEAFVIDSDAPGLTRRIIRARAERVTSPRAARSFRALLVDGGFTDVTASVRTAVFTGEAALPMVRGLAQPSGAVSGGEVDGWIAEQTARAKAGRLLVAVPVFVAAATRPG